MASLNDITIVVPVREGSSRLKEKIHLPFMNGLSLLEWKIEQLKKVQSPELITISSNSDRVAATCKQRGVRYHDRGDYLSVGHQASFSEVICGIVKDIKTPHFAWVTVVVPLMTPDEYAAGFEAYIRQVCEEKTHDSLVAVNLMKEYYWDENGPINYQANRNHTISQELPVMYRVTNGLYMRDVDATLREGYFLGKKPVMFQVSKISGVDIDEMEDYQIARALGPIVGQVGNR